MKTDKPIECKNCNTFDVGTILDNTGDRDVVIERIFTTQAEAEQGLAYLTKVAHDVETEPCTIDSQILPVNEGFKLEAKFSFSCQAEGVIFQLKSRSF